MQAGQAVLQNAPYRVERSEDDDSIILICNITGLRVRSADAGATRNVFDHAGASELLREQIDGAAGLRAEASNLPEQQDWPAYVAKLTALAERF